MVNQKLDHETSSIYRKPRFQCQIWFLYNFAKIINFISKVMYCDLQILFCWNEIQLKFNLDFIYFQILWIDLLLFHIIMTYKKSFLIFWLAKHYSNANMIIKFCNIKNAFRRMIVTTFFIRNNCHKNTCSSSHRQVSLNTYE